jgi:predicted RNase H-like HicB family nuclease
MLRNYTAKYIKISNGYMGQLIEWPEIITEGRDIEECRRMLRDALRQMILAYKELNKEVPVGDGLIEQLPVDIQNVYQTA